MDPHADDLYERLGANPQEPHSDLRKKISKFHAFYSSDYPEKKTEIETKLKDIDSRKAYNKKQGYPTTFGDVVPLSISGPDTAEVDETITIVVVDDNRDPVSDVSVTAGGTDFGNTDQEGKCSLAFHTACTTSITATKQKAGDTEYADATSELEISKETRPLAVETDTTEVAVGERLPVTVRAAGETVPGATVTVGSITKTTDEYGTCTVDVFSTGTKTVTVTKSDNDDVTYVDDEVTVEVEKRDVSLNLSVDSHTVEVGEAVSFSVTDGNGNGVGDASLTCDGSTATTDTHGQAELTFTEAKTAVVDVSKPNDEITRYGGDTVEIDVKRQVFSLSVEAFPHSVAVRNTVTVQVTADVGAVENASVTAADTTKTTDGSGKCTFDFSSTGDVRIRATKADTPTATYEPATTTVTVTKTTRELAIETDQDTVTVRERLSVRVSDGTGGIADATVDAPKTNKRTDNWGTCTLRPQTMGEIELTARRSDTEDIAYSSATTTVTVEPKHVDLTVSATPSKAEFEKDIAVTVTADGDPVPDTNVRADNITKRTDANGSCTLSPPSTGTVEITADRDDTAVVEYISDRTTVEIEPTTKDLHIDGPDNAEPGESAHITVYDENGSRVEGVTVESPVDRTKTDDRGTCAVELPTVGHPPVTIRAKKTITDTVEYNASSVPIAVDGLEPPANESTGPTAVVISVVAVVLLVPIAAAATVYDVRSDLVVTSLVGLVLVGITALRLTAQR